jgi:zinc and cadmium transporter
MIINLLLLFGTAFAAGLLVFVVPKDKSFDFRLTLVFAGAYLFSITIIHILPEIFSAENTPAGIGIFILIGFFLQLFLEYFTSGVEHGHIHKPTNHGHSHGHISPVFLLLALCIHAFLEGTLLSHPSDSHHHDDVRALLIGIILHKMPAAFALMSVLLYQLENQRKAVLFLLIFSLASPFGMLVSAYFNEYHLISQNAFTILYAIVSGNFLHISTTIFFESSPEHKFNARKLVVSMVGALIAVVAEQLM